MWTLNRYVTMGFLLSFGMAMIILTFGMTGANIIKVIDLLSQGVPVSIFLRGVGYMLPSVLTFTIPWAVMVAVMLVFGRMSADNEITAMRACGISILQVVSPILLITVALTALCLYLQVEVAPPALGKSRLLLREAAGTSPTAIFEPGKQLTIGDKAVIYIDDKVGDNGLKGIQLYLLKNSNEIKNSRNPYESGVTTDISAASGEIKTDEKTNVCTIILRDCMVENDSDHLESEGVERFYTKELSFQFDFSADINKESLVSRPKYMRLKDLMANINLVKRTEKNPRRRIEESTDLEVELNQRIAFALAPIAFLLLGLPMAIHANRRETSVGLFLSIIMAGLFFLLIIVCEQFSDRPELYPQYLLWLPNIIFQGSGAVMTYKVSQR